MRDLSWQIGIWTVVGLFLILLPMVGEYYGIEYYVITAKGTPADFGDSDLVAFRGNNKYGYQYRNTGKVVIPARFAQAKPFGEGLAAVDVDGGEWGYIDKAGQIVIKPQFKETQPFSEGLAAVKAGEGEWGYIDKTGQIVINPQFRRAQPFSEGVAAVETGGRKYIFIDRVGNAAIATEFRYAESFSNGTALVVQMGGDRWAAIDKTGQKIVEYASQISAKRSKSGKTIKKARWDFYATVAVALLWGLSFIYWLAGKARNDEKIKKKINPWILILWFSGFPFLVFAKWRIGFTEEVMLFLVFSAAISPILAGLIIYRRLQPSR